MMMGRHGQMLQNEARKPTAVSATLARFWVYFKSYWYLLFVVAGLVILTTYLQVLTPNLTGQAVDCFLTPATEKLFGATGSSAGAGITAAASPNCWY
ncbi:MAG: hypothetical protein M1482_13615, partial [Chloroflexi bacterium]|nr:hypothetical protein [Chloroflexota bacterium]